MEKHITMVYIKRLFLKIRQSSRENTRAGVSFFLKLQATSLQFYLKRDFDTGDSHAVLQKI